jgi:hypothetical protein
VHHRLLNEPSETMSPTNIFASASTPADATAVPARSRDRGGSRQPLRSGFHEIYKISGLPRHPNLANSSAIVAI